MDRTNAERQRRYVARLKEAKADAAESSRYRERLHATSVKLELSVQDVARLTARNDYLEKELKRVELHNHNLLKELIVLKQATAQSRKR